MDVEHFDFADHLDSILWIEQLPKGLVEQRIDLRYKTVTLTKKPDRYELYIGPREDQLGGDGVSVKLNHEFQLIEYEIERIAPIP